MILRKLGVKQLLIIKKCKAKGSIWVGEVFSIYPFSHSNSKRALVELEKLELYGYLKPKKDVDNTFVLTEKGYQYLDLNDRG